MSVDSGLEIPFEGFSNGRCVLLDIFLIRDVEDIQFNLIDGMLRR